MGFGVLLFGCCFGCLLFAMVCDFGLICRFWLLRIYLCLVVAFLLWVV